MNWKILLTTGVLVLTILLLVVYIQGLNAASECKFVPRSLVGASRDEIEKAALDFMCAKYETFGVAPEIRMARFVTTGELASMFDEGRSDVGCPDQQLALVILGIVKK